MIPRGEMESKGLLRCKIVVVGDSQCGKTALLHVFAKDSYTEVRMLLINEGKQVGGDCCRAGA